MGRSINHHPLPTTQIKQWDSNKIEENKMKTLGSKAYIYFNKFEINQIHNLVENYKTHTKIGLNNF